ncbi:fructose-bisphosphate aldolase-lysine N-methyltransferase, chloroplastic-like [Zingiber officinale]|uniref:fructose-bisphosphate aldolase-lysine N-methyltransferase, chloroplastic-like n=1 Tax=Zingiber officinale TaxID=94328 RepID=UPI001C4CD958|nr:fructose-bisphosphate aldolase-lysine N-methyltransferase, chloroplastic-like [Zingiber officinale]
MRIGVRVARSLFASPDLPPPVFATRALRSKYSFSVFCPEKEHVLVEESANFLQWLRGKTGTDISSVLALGNSTYGRSLIALKNIKAGDCILKVPYLAQITSESLSSEIEQLLPRNIGNVSWVAIVLLAEKKLRQSSEWFTYLNCLPCMDEMHNAIFWRKDELKMICKSPVYQETISQQAYIEKEFSALRPVLEMFPDVFGKVHLENFMHAYALVSSRAWETSKGVSLIPFADFLNHDCKCGAVLLSDVDKEISEVIADRDYAIGEQVMIRYGKFSNATLLLDFGFTLQHNLYDQVQLHMDIPLHDPLYATKTELVEKHCSPRISSVDKSNSTGNFFIIKEVKSASSKGKGIPQALRAFVRILSATSIEELQALLAEAAENDGRLARRPLKSKEREVQAHHILCSRLFLMIEGHNTALKMLNSQDDTDYNLRPSIRTRMAVNLLSGELRIMQSAYNWLENYCKRLSGAKEEDALPLSADTELG